MTVHVKINIDTSVKQLLKAVVTATDEINETSMLYGPQNLAQKRRLLVSPIARASDFHVPNQYCEPNFFEERTSRPQALGRLRAGQYQYELVNTKDGWEALGIKIGNLTSSTFFDNFVSDPSDYGRSGN